MSADLLTATPMEDADAVYASDDEHVPECVVDLKRDGPLKMIFTSPPKKYETPQAVYFRLFPKIQTADGRVLEPFMNMPRNLRCFGINENLNEKTREVKDHSMGVSMWGVDDPSEEVRAWHDAVQGFAKDWHEHVCRPEIAAAIGETGMTVAELRKSVPFPPNRIDRKTGEVSKYGPIMSMKLGRNSRFHNVLDDGTTVPNIDVIARSKEVKRGFSVKRGIVKIFSIFLGTMKSMQFEAAEMDISYGGGGGPGGPSTSLLHTRPIFSQSVAKRPAAAPTGGLQLPPDAAAAAAATTPVTPPAVPEAPAVPAQTVPEAPAVPAPVAAFGNLSMPSAVIKVPTSVDDDDSGGDSGNDDADVTPAPVVAAPAKAPARRPAAKKAGAV
jgi:hypothetical protein